MNKKIVFFDIDRTLYDPVTKSIPVKTIESIKRLSLKEDIILAIATGRASYMFHVIESVKEYFDIFVTINGHIIIKDGVTVFKDPMSYDDVVRIVNVLNRYQLKFGFLGEHTESLNIVDEKAKEAFELVSMDLPKVDKDFYKENEVFQMWAMCEQEHIQNIKNELHDFSVVSWLGGGFDILKKGMSKKIGIEYILNLLQLTTDDLYVFGDGDNDIEMLSLTNNSVCMGNGSKKALETASIVTGTIEEEGIYNGLLRVGLLDD